MNKLKSTILNAMYSLGVDVSELIAVKQWIEESYNIPEEGFNVYFVTNSSNNTHMITFKEPLDFENFNELINNKEGYSSEIDEDSLIITQSETAGRFKTEQKIYFNNTKYTRFTLEKKNEQFKPENKVDKAKLHLLEEYHTL